MAVLSGLQRAASADGSRRRRPPPLRYRRGARGDSCGQFMLRSFEDQASQQIQAAAWSDTAQSSPIELTAQSLPWPSRARARPRRTAWDNSDLIDLSDRLESRDADDWRRDVQKSCNSN